MKKETREFKVGCLAAEMFSEIFGAALAQGHDSPFIFSARQLSSEVMSEAQIEKIEEGSVRDTIMTAADIMLYELNTAKKAISEEAYPHVVRAVEGAFLLSEYLSGFTTEEACKLGDALRKTAAKHAISNQASNAAKARNKDQKQKVITRYHELLKYEHFKNGSRASIARKIASEPGITVTETTVGRWIKAETA